MKAVFCPSILRANQAFSFISLLYKATLNLDIIKMFIIN